MRVIQVGEKTYSLLENGSIRILSRLPDLVLSGSRVDNPIFTGSPLGRRPPEISIETLHLVDSTLEVTIDLSDLRGVTRATSITPALQPPNLLGKALVCVDNLAVDAVDVAGAVGHALEEVGVLLAQTAHLAVDVPDGGADLLALVEDGVGVVVGGWLADHGLHFDITIY